MLSSPCYLCLIENASVYIYIYTCIFFDFILQLIYLLLQWISCVHHVQDRSNQQVQLLRLQASVYCTSGSNWLTKGLHFFLATCFFSIWRPERHICQKEELRKTAVGCSWLLCKVWKVMSTPPGFLLRKSIACSAVQQVLEWTPHTHSDNKYGLHFNL